MPPPTGHDKTLNKDEYLALVEQWFKSADADGDGSVSAAEFGTPTGRALAAAFGLASPHPADLQHDLLCDLVGG